MEVLYKSFNKLKETVFPCLLRDTETDYVIVAVEKINGHFRGFIVDKHHRGSHKIGDFASIPHPNAEVVHGDITLRL